MGSSAQLLWREIDVFSEGFTDPLVDGVFDQDPVFVFGGVGSARKVAGETRTRKSGQTSESVIKEAASADFFKVGLRHRINLYFGDIRSRVKGIR